MIESGLALVAACLPTIHYLFVQKSPASTSSGITNVAAATSGQPFSQLKKTQGSETDLANVIYGQAPSAHVEAFAMGAVEPRQAQDQTPTGDEIWLNNTITQGIDMV